MGKPIPIERKLKMVELYEAGFSGTQIGKLVGLSQPTVWFHLNNMGVKLKHWQRKPSDSAEYSAMHHWIRARKPKAIACEVCSGTKPRLELANVSGLYMRDINDYVWLCTYCHRKQHDIDKEG